MGLVDIQLSIGLRIGRLAKASCLRIGNNDVLRCVD